MGSDTWVFECDDRLLCVDAGYSLTATELERILRDLYPQWDQVRKELMLTHGDTDHVGACNAFGCVYASGRTIDGFTFESMGIVNWRKQNLFSFPYARIGSVLSSYRTPDLSRMVCLGEPSPLGEQEGLLERIDTLEIAPLTFGEGESVGISSGEGCSAGISSGEARQTGFRQIRPREMRFRRNIPREPQFQQMARVYPPVASHALDAN